MNANNCGKGLAIFSITLVLGIGIASLFISEKQTKANSEQPKNSNQSKPICVKKDNHFGDHEDGEMVLIPCEADNKIYFLEPGNDSRENIEKNKSKVKELKSILKNKNH
jgi:uncharacterized membrane protein